MLEPNLIEIFTRPLDDNHIDYLITGSVASVIGLTSTYSISVAPWEKAQEN